MDRQDLTHLKEQYAQMRIDNRPQPMRELLTENPSIEREKVWPQWLLDEEKGIGTFFQGSYGREVTRADRFYAIWRHVLKASKPKHGRGCKVTYLGTDYWFAPTTNKMYLFKGCHSSKDTVIQPAIHLLIKAMD